MVAKLIDILPRFWFWIVSRYIESAYYKLFISVYTWFVGLGKESAIVSYVTMPFSEDAVYKKSLFYKLFSKLNNALSKRTAFTKAFIRDIINGSDVFSFVDYIADNYYNISLCYYGVLILAFSTINALMGRFIYNITIKSLYMDFVLAAFGVVLVLINRTPINLYNTSFFRRLIRLPDILAQAELKLSKNTVGIAAGLGIALGLIPSGRLGLMLAVGMLAVLLMLKRPEIATVFILILFPFMPTMGLVGLIILTVLGLYIQSLNKTVINKGVDIYDFSMLGLWFAFSYSIISSGARMSSLKIALVYFVFTGFFFVIKRMDFIKKNLFLILDYMLYAAGIVAGYGIYQQLTGTSVTTWQDTEMFGDIAGRVTSTFANPNVLGEYLLLLIPICAARLMYCKKPLERLIFIVILSLLSLCMVYTMSRGCWIGVIIAMLIFIMLACKKIFSFSAVGVLMLPILLPQSIVKRFTSIGNMSDSSTSYRVYIWEGTMKMLKTFWLCGTGLGSDAYNTVYPFYAYSQISAPHAHSLYLVLFSEIGIIGIIAVAFLVYVFFRTLIQAGRDNSIRPLAIALGSAMSGFLIQGMFDNVWYNYRIFLFFFIMLAFASVLKQMAVKGVTDSINE